MKFCFEITVEDGATELNTEMTLYGILQGVSPQLTAEVAQLPVDGVLEQDALYIFRSE